MAIFLAPISAGIKINDKQQLVVRVEVTEARAQSSADARNDNFAKELLKKEGEVDYTRKKLNLGCSFFFGGDGLIGCIAEVFYMIWEVSANIVRFAGEILDFFVYYSTNSSSYTNDFVEKAWAAVRDIANIFFIIALLYVGIKTILGLNVTDNKKLVSAVILIALIINFSLFTTKVVIDASNILAKVFYNNITSNVIGLDDQKSISVGLVDKFDPQEVIDYNQTKYDDSRGYFIFITVFLIAISLFAAYIFFSVALLFVARVVSLWISMIFSPLAFISYTVPFEIPGFGHKEWWSELFKNAFLAPMFIFFLYIIVLFADFLKTITDKSDSLMTVVIPFIILAVLLMKAKKIAVDYSGAMGQAVMKGAQMVGGLALGAGTGVAALAMTSTIGARARATANDDNLRAQASGDEKHYAEHFAKNNITDVKEQERVKKQMQAAAQKKLASANKTAARSFDFGQTGLGKGFGKMSGMDLTKGRIGETKTENLKGGRTAQQERVQEEAQKRSKSYEMTGEEEANRNAPAEKYLKEKNKASEKSDTDLPERKKAYEKEYASKLGQNKLSMNPVDEKTFEENYKKNNPPPTSSFDEEAFKENYIKENKLKKDDITHVNRTEVNKERRTAYANSLQDEADKNEARGIIKTFFAEWGKGMKKMVTTPG